MKNFFIIFVIMSLIFSKFAYSETKKADPNLSKTRNKSTVIAPGCTEFVHPCSGQAAVALLNATTTPMTSKAAIKPPATAASGAKTK